MIWLSYTFANVLQDQLGYTSCVLGVGLAKEMYGFKQLTDIINQHRRDFTREPEHPPYHKRMTSVRKARILVHRLICHEDLSRDKAVHKAYHTRKLDMEFRDFEAAMQKDFNVIDFNNENKRVWERHSSGLPKNYDLSRLTHIDTLLDEIKDGKTTIKPRTPGITTQTTLGS